MDLQLERKQVSSIDDPPRSKTVPQKKEPQVKRSRRSPSDPLAQLAQLLLGSAQKAAPVLLARDAPEDYVRGHAKELKQRGVSSSSSVPLEVLVWIALVDAMRRDRRAAEIDWRSPPDEVAAELKALRPAIPRAAWTRVAPAIADEAAAEDFLRTLARAVKEADPAMLLARLDKVADTFVVAPIKTSDFPEAAKLIRSAGLGTISDLARVEPRKPTTGAGRIRTAAAGGRRSGGWRGFLATKNAANTHAILLAAANDRAVAQELAAHVEEAPKEERAAIRVFVALLMEDARGVRSEDPLDALEALRYLSFAPGYERQCFERTCDVLSAIDQRTAGVRSLRAAVAAIRFALRPAEAGAVFRTLDADCQRVLREVVQQSLTSKDAPSLVAALDAARVVGGVETARLVKDLATHPLPVVATHAKKAARSLPAR